MILNANFAVSVNSMLNALFELLGDYANLVVVGCVFFALVLLSLKCTRTFLENHSGALGIILALIAGSYVFREYQISEYDERLNRTRSYIERIESGAVHEARQWLDLHWIKNRELILEIDEANYGENASRDTAKALMSDYERSFDEQDEENMQNIMHVMRLFYFYSDLAKCVELELCEARTACEVFADDIGKFYVLHSAFISRWRQVSFEQSFNSIKQFMNTTCDPILEQVQQ